MEGKRDLSGLANEVAKRTQDAVYVAVGLGILGCQKVQTRRSELTNLASRAGKEDERMAQLRNDALDAARQIVEWTNATTRMVDASLSHLEEHLPEPAQQIVSRTRAQLHSIGALLHQVVSSGS